MRLRGTAKSTPIQVRFSPEERAWIHQAARVNRQTVSTFIRDVVLLAADECLEDQEKAS